MDKNREIAQIHAVIEKEPTGARWFYAQAIYEAGYRQVPEGAVVFTENEYKALKGEKKLCNKCGKYFYVAWTACPYCGDIPNNIKWVRKETAKKILQDLYALASKNKYNRIDIGDILFYAKENYELEYNDFEVN